MDKEVKKLKNSKFKISLNLILIILVFASCGDSWSDYTWSIDNKTEYNIVINSTGLKLENNLCPPNKVTVVFQDEPRSPKKLNCHCPPLILKEQIEFVVDDGKKHLTKDFFNDNNWDCSGDKKSSLIMVGKYYDNIKSIFIITEDDLSE